MTTVAFPVSVRDLAMTVIAAKLGTSAGLSDRLEEIGNALLADLLITLEDRFDIGIDPDELLPNGTIGVLVALVDLRANAAPSGGRIYHWDDERARRALPLARPLPIIPTDADFAACEAHHASEDAPPADPPRIDVAVPSDEAWALAAKLYDRERRRSLMFGWVAFGFAACAPASLIFALTLAHVL